MKDVRIRNITIISTIAFLIIVSLLLWFNREKLIWLETVTVIKKAYSIDLGDLEVECEYENALRRFYENDHRHGHILVSFTCSSEYAEEVLCEYKDELSEHLIRKEISGIIGIEELKGKSLQLNSEYTRPFLSRQRCKCILPSGFIHVQDLENGNVSVYIFYPEF